jgi:predicted glycogen debranching enzyme
MITFGSEITGDFALAARREWWVTNGLGGWASGTVSGANTRRYHGLFVPALKPPLGRTVLVEKLNETARYGDQTFDLSSNEYGDGAIHPHGHQHIERFALEGTVPAWTYALADARLEKRVWMPYGRNAVYVACTLARASGPLDLEATLMVTHRDAHAETLGGWEPHVVSLGAGVLVHAHATTLTVLATGGQFTPLRQWHWNIHHRIEAGRGLPAREDQFAAGRFTVTLQPGDSWVLVASLDQSPDLDWKRSLAAVHARERDLIAQSGLVREPDWIQQLVLAADQFIVGRGAGHTVIAGYPWFGDWGRDTMIALPGLTLTTRRYDVAATILRTFAGYVSDGMLPNRFPDVGEAPEYNTVDATLWFFHALDRYTRAVGDLSLARELWPLLEDIIAWHLQGTRYGIRADPASGLLAAGVPGVQLTWMDAKVGDRVITPRHGKPVEINALWINALRVMERLVGKLSVAPAQPYARLAAQAQSSFDRFWNADAGCLYDVLDGPGGADAAVRPNQLIALSLPYGPLTGSRSLARARSIVTVCARQLFTSHGLRSLAPGHPNYTRRFNGPAESRDAAYHQGTVWAWLIGPLADAHRLAFDDPDGARAILTPFEHHLADAGLGSVSEVFEPAPPFGPAGCPAQAWSVAEVLRAWVDAVPRRRTRRSP